jgi:hypothetical protein
VGGNMSIKSTPIHVLNGTEYYLKEYWDAQATVIVESNSNKILDPQSIEYSIVLADYQKSIINNNA